MTTTTDISSLQEHRILKKSNENSLKIRNTTSNKKKLKLRNHPKIHLINVQYKLASNTRKVTFANTPPDLIQTQQSRSHQKINNITSLFLSQKKMLLYLKKELKILILNCLSPVATSDQNIRNLKLKTIHIEAMMKVNLKIKDFNSENTKKCLVAEVTIQTPNQKSSVKIALEALNTKVAEVLEDLHIEVVQLVEVAEFLNRKMNQTMSTYHALKITKNHGKHNHVTT